MIGHLAYFFQRKVTVVVIQTGSILLLLSTVMAWVHLEPGPEALNGNEVSTLVRLIGLLGVVSGLLVSIFQGWLRGILAAVLLGGGFLAIITAALTIFNPVAASVTGMQQLGLTAETARLAFGAWFGLAGAILLSIGALAALLFSSTWNDEPETKKTR